VPATIKRIRIFVASPGDVADERTRLDRMVQGMNRTGGTAERLGLFLELLRWETHAAPDAGRPQGIVFDQLPPQEWDIFVGILWLRFGSETGERDPDTGQPYRSGTEEEFKAAYGLREASTTPWPKVAVYRCSRPPADMLRLDLAQYARIQQFFEGFKAGGPHPGLVQPYDKPEDFERMVREHLEKWIWEYAEQSRQLEPAEAKSPEKSAPPSPVSQLPAKLAPLRDELAQRFTKEDLRALCFDLGVDYDDLPSATKINQSQDLILYLERTGRLDELIARCRQLRPNVKWDDLGHVTGTGDLRSLEVPVTSVRSKPKPDLSPLRERYLREVWDACCNLKLTSIDVKVATGRGEAAELALNAVFTDLDVFEAPPRVEMTPAKARRPAGERGERSDDGKRSDNRLPAMAALSKYPRLVLLGDPGSGKSTLVNFVALCLAGAWLHKVEANRKRLGEASKLPSLLPVRVILRDYAARGLPQDKGLWQFIQDELKATPNSAGDSLAPCIPAIAAALAARRGALLLLDGVDEVPEAQNCRVRLKEKIEQFGRDFPQCRIVVTSRPYAYQDEKARLTGFEVRTLADFSPEQVQTFIGRWYEHVGQRDRSLGPAKARQYAAQLQAAVEQNPRLADLAPRPLLLTLMASLHRWQEGGRLPEKRQALYEASVGLLLDLWQRPKQVFGAQGRSVGIEYDVWRELGIGAEALRKALELAAYEAHLNQPSTQGTHDIRARDLVGVLYERSDKAKTGAAADAGERRIVTYLTNRAGLLIEREQGRVYAFPHRTFQEYLAACHLASTDFPYLLADRLREDDGRWREASLLAAARAVTGSPAPIWNLVAGFCPRDVPVGPDRVLPRTADWYAALRAAEALIETELHREVPERQAALLERLRKWLIALIEQGVLPAAERVAAGDTLGRLGDPRPGVGLTAAGDPSIVWCGVSSGQFIMGSRDDSESVYGKETPQQRIDLPAYRISKYLITNAQYDAFAQDGGYTVAWRRYWTDAGWQWKEKRTTPEQYGGVFDLPNHPVVNVTSYEALAFCGWLSEKLGHPVTLPTEAQWEKAARGPDGGATHRYPWGDKITPEHANYDETGIGTTTAVGIFPQGTSPYGALDMAGNAWEWCLTQWRSDYTQPVDDDPAGDAPRVLRGGAFHGYKWDVRCASRYSNNPNHSLRFYGFRVVAPPVIHDSGL